jgi:hypothetical protein
MRLGLPDPLICVHTSHWFYGYHLLHCAHGNKCTGTYDAIHNTFVAITRDVNFHVGQKQLHAFPSITFNSFRQQINIVLTKDGIRNLANVIIIDPMWTNLFWFCTTQGFVTSDVTQAKEKNYHNRHPIDQFLPLAIEVFGCLHKHADVFLHNHANVIWNLKGTKSPHLFTLVTFLHWKVSITWQRCKCFPS